MPVCNVFTIPALRKEWNQKFTAFCEASDAAKAATTITATASGVADPQIDQMEMSVTATQQGTGAPARQLG